MGRWFATLAASLSTTSRCLGRCMRAILSLASAKQTLGVMVVLLALWLLYASPWGFWIWWASRPWTLR